MSRPKGSKNKKTLLNEAKELKTHSGTGDAFSHLSDMEILSKVHERFQVMNKFATGTINGKIRGLILSGAPGVGKTHTISEILRDHSVNNPNFKYQEIRGSITPVNLFKVLQNNRRPGNVVIMDDTDSIFWDGESLNLLKAAMDSGDERWISWLSESAMLKSEGYDRTFKYEGSMIFITNIDFQHIIDKGTSKLAPHFDALMSRTIYLDLMIQSRRTIGLWIDYMIRRKNILVEGFGLSGDQQSEVLVYLKNNRDIMRTLSIREALKIAQMMDTEPDLWKSMADVTLLKEIVHD